MRNQTARHPATTDEALLAEMLGPPPLTDAEEALAIWRARRAALPLHRRSARREADAMIEVWQVRVRAAKRHEGCYGLTERLADGLTDGLRPVRRWLKRAVLVFALAVAGLITAVLGLIAAISWMI